MKKTKRTKRTKRTKITKKTRKTKIYIKRGAGNTMGRVKKVNISQPTNNNVINPTNNDVINPPNKFNMQDFNERKGKLNPEFEKTTQTNRLQNFINVVCKYSKDNCISLGIYQEMIYHFFDNFKNFHLIDTENTKQIGVPSKNGFIWSIPFKKEGLTSHCVLKCSLNKDADNLYYEYYVGKYFINHYAKQFSCFVETYDSYKLNKIKWEQLLNNKSNVNLDDGEIKLYNEGFKESCTDNEYLCLLIQHFEPSRFISLFEIYNDYVTNFDIKYKYDIPCYLFQVYFVLSYLGNNYTHYDLHPNNVFCYKPFNEKEYIVMNYHLENGEILSFPTEFIVKIIDYGRNFFNNKKTNTEEILNNEICNNEKCNPNCGVNFGYNVIQGNINYSGETYINPNKANVSCDLRLLNFFDVYFNNSYFFEENLKINFDNSYGTKELKENKFTEINEDGTFSNNLIINNIFDAKNFLQFFIKKYLFKMFLSKYYIHQYKQVGIINVYSDGRPYEFIPNNINKPYKYPMYQNSDREYEYSSYSFF
jgi:hypothetical protein